MSAIWSATTEFGEMALVPNDTLDFQHTQQDPNHRCGFDHTVEEGQNDDQGDPFLTDISGNPSQDICTTDDADWANASPYTEWLNQNATEAVYGPVFMANGGGPYDPAHPELYQYARAETEAVTDAYDFRDLLQGRQ